MPKLECKCGKVINLSPIPCPNERLVFSSAIIEQVFHALENNKLADAEQLLEDEALSTIVCESCGRYFVSKGKDSNSYTTLVPEAIQSFVSMAKDNECNPMLQHSIALTQSFLGAISPNFRIVWISSSSNALHIHIVLEQDLSEDRDEIEDAMTEFEAKYETNIDYECFVDISKDSIPWPKEPSIVVYRRRETNILPSL